MSYDDPQMMYLEEEARQNKRLGRGTKNYSEMTIEERLKVLTEQLYSSRTCESARRDISMTVAILRQQLGAPTIDSMSNASEEEEEGS